MRHHDRLAVACICGMALALAGTASFAEPQSKRQIVIQPADPSAQGAPAATPSPDGQPPAGDQAAPAVPGTPAPADQAAPGGPPAAGGPPASGQPPAGQPAAAGQPVPGAAPPPGQQAAACDPAAFVDTKGLVDAIAADLGRLQNVRVRTVRYLTLTNFTNLCDDDATLNVYRQAAIKLLNSLSRTSEVVRLETIDPRQSIIRFNIADLGWSAADWDSMLAFYPYGALPDSALNAVLEKATLTKLPFVRADWFAFVATRAPIYNKLLALPATLQALAHDQGVDIAADIHNSQAQRAGFQTSGESLNNRLIERHPSRSGYFWMTYDFAGNRGRQNLFEFPLGPGGEQSFAADASSVVFSLANGFQGYYQANAHGDVADRGQTQIVRDPNNPDLAVTTAISCMSCHSGGVHPVSDEIRASVLRGGQLPHNLRDAIDGLYPPADKMKQLMDEDGSRYSSAMTRAGLDPALRLNDVEPVTALSRQYERAVDVTEAAAELGLTADEFAKAASDVDKKLKSFVRRLQQGPVPRDQFEAAFPDLVDDITDDDSVRVAPVHVVAPPPPVHVAPPPAYTPPAVHVAPPTYTPPQPRYQGGTPTPYYR